MRAGLYPVAHVTVPLSMISDRGRSRNPVLGVLPLADACQRGEHRLAAFLGNPVVRPVTRFGYDRFADLLYAWNRRRAPVGGGAAAPLPTSHHLCANSLRALGRLMRRRLRRRRRRHRIVEYLDRRVSWICRLAVRPARCHRRSDQHRDPTTRGSHRIAPASAAVAQDQRDPGCGGRSFAIAAAAHAAAHIHALREEPARIPIIPLAIGTKIASNPVEHGGG